MECYGCATEHTRWATDRAGAGILCRTRLDSILPLRRIPGILQRLDVTHAVTTRSRLSRPYVSCTRQRLVTHPPLHMEVIGLHVAGAAAVAADAERAAVDVPVEVELRGGRGVDAELGDQA